MGEIDLSQMQWTLDGWRPYMWKLSQSAEIGPFPAKVPGSIQAALREAGLLPDWHVGLNSRLCEWAEHRHWRIETVLPAGIIPQGETAALVAQGLDYSGWVMVDGREVAEFRGALLPTVST